jgi:hypothetical protein
MAAFSPCCRAEDPRSRDDFLVADLDLQVQPAPFGEIAVLLRVLNREAERRLIGRAIPYSLPTSEGEILRYDVTRRDANIKACESQEVPMASRFLTRPDTMRHDETR